uniref:EamA domain-containing protein n=1 Tax=Skeletonema marinoi TaxID=267567 RepID=A0A7S2LK32_9STRA
MQLTSPQLWESFLPQIDYSRRRYAIGLFFILCQCIVWIAAAVITQFVYEENDDTSPFLMTYIGMALMALFLPIELWNDWWARKSNEAAKRSNDDGESPDDDHFNVNRTIETFDSFDEDLMSAKTPYCLFSIMCDRTLELTDQTKQLKPWNHKKHMLAALQIAPAMFLADWAFNNALRRTSVASATVIVSSQNVVVFLLAVLTKIEGFCWIKLGGVLISMVGIALTAVHDTSDENMGELLNADAIYGDLFALAAAVSYGIYTVQVRLFCPQNEDLYKMQLLMGYIGLVVMVPCLPFAAYMIYNVRHDFTLAILGCIVLKGLLDFVLTDYFLFRSVVLTSATTATVGLGLTIPMAFVADLIFSPEYVISIYSVIGAVAVGFGFISVSLSGNDGGEVKQEEKEENIEPSVCSQDGGALATNFVVLPGWAQT